MSLTNTDDLRIIRIAHVINPATLIERLPVIDAPLIQRHRDDLLIVMRVYFKGPSPNRVGHLGTDSFRVEL